MLMQQPRNFRNVVSEFNAARRRLRMLTIMTLEPGPPKRRERICGLERHARAEVRIRLDEVLTKTRAFMAQHGGWPGRPESAPIDGGCSPPTAGYEQGMPLNFS
jgi:hypothetical protein